MPNITNTASFELNYQLLYIFHDKWTNFLVLSKNYTHNTYICAMMVHKFSWKLSPNITRINLLYSFLYCDGNDYFSSIRFKIKTQVKSFLLLVTTVHVFSSPTCSQSKFTTPNYTSTWTSVPVPPNNVAPGRGSTMGPGTRCHSAGTPEMRGSRSTDTTWISKRLVRVYRGEYFLHFRGVTYFNFF